MLAYLGDSQILCYKNINNKFKMLDKEQINTFLKELAESIELPEGALTPETEIANIEWDSLAIISCIALADEQFNTMLSGDELANISNIGDIFELISKKK